MCEILVFLYIAKSTYQLVRTVRAAGVRAHFKDVWNCFELVFLLFAWFAIAFYLVRLFWLDSAMRKWKQGDRTAYFGSFAELSHLNGPVNLGLGLAAWLATLNFVRLLRFNKRIIMMLGIIDVAVHHLFGFAILFVILMAAFSILGHLWFGTTERAFASVYESLLTLVCAALGDYTMMEWELESSTGRLMMPVFMIVLLAWALFHFI